MNTKNSSLFQKIDCLQLYVPNLEQGINYYHENLGLPIAWKTETAVAFLLGDGIGELVIQNKDKWNETDVKVERVEDAVEKIMTAGGKVIHGPFDIAVGKCAVVADPWENQIVLLDSSKGTFVTDEKGNIIGQK